METGDLDRLVAAVQESSKYRHVWPDFIRRLASAELNHGRKPKEALKAIKNKLHQVGAAYAGSRPDYGTWRAALAALDRKENPEGFRQLCRRMMGEHASTRERLPVLEEIYSVSLKDLEPLHSVLDAACGLNPLTIPWMPLAPGAQYTACDIFLDLLEFLEIYLKQAGVAGTVYPCDLTSSVPADSVDLVLLMKALPCLEQVDKHVSARLLRDLKARHILVSFPALSLGGHSRGMEEYYPAHFSSLLEGNSWTWHRFDFETEIVFRLDCLDTPEK